MRQSALVLLGLPDDAVWADGLEFVPFGEKNAEIEVVSHVDPDDDEEAEVGADEGVVDVVEGFGCLQHISGLSHVKLIEGSTYSKEEIRDIVGNVDWKSHVGEVETI